jgi:hypothetical protein
MVKVVCDLLSLRYKYYVQHFVLKHADTEQQVKVYLVCMNIFVCSISRDKSFGLINSKQSRI